jgi:hypothetical protein
VTLTLSNEEPADSAMSTGSTEEHLVKPEPITGGAIQKEAHADRIKLIDKLTDIPAIDKYACRIGAVDRSLKRLAVVEERGAYKSDMALINFAEDGSITVEGLGVSDDLKPRPDEQEAIKAEWKSFRRPEYMPLLFTARDQPENDPRYPWSMPPWTTPAVCWDAKRQHILCVEVRRERDGRKEVCIFSPFENGEWRIAEPPETLPLYGIETIASAATIFVHEGPKAAKAVQALIADDSAAGWRSHPWGRELRGELSGGVAHVGWLGGARRPEATDWKPLIAAHARVIVVADNDEEGVDAVCRISRASLMRMEALRFTDDWPRNFDLADPFPACRAKAGTRLADMLTPATWATDRIETDGRPAFRARDEFIRDWKYTVSPPLFFHASYPGRGYTDTEVDAMTRPFSHAELTARLIRQRFSAQAHGVAYRPGSKPVIERKGQRLVNMWTPTSVRERSGAAWPLGRLLTALVPDPADRRHLTRWGATLAACPTTRMEYAVLMTSKTQGLGKTTLANILAELVGDENVSRPSETALTEGNFNSHFAKKRLVIVDELYTGHSRKTYNRLKSPITDTKLRVNEKFKPEYEIDNFAHFVFSSNDAVPIFVDEGDRRFFMPKMAEKKLPRAFWVKFHTWLESGGYGIMLRCAREFVRRHGSVEPGQVAPDTAAKRDMVADSVSDPMQSVRDAARDIFQRGSGDSGERIAVTLEDFALWHASMSRANSWKKLSGRKLEAELRDAGMCIRKQVAGGCDLRVKIGGRNVSIASNFDSLTGDGGAEAVRSATRAMSDLGFATPM